MFFSTNSLTREARVRAHFTELMANRAIYNTQHDLMVNQFRPNMTQEMLACNAIGGFHKEFWAEIDRQIILLKDQEDGMEVVNDLLTVATTLPIGKTAKLYTMSGDIAEDVSISIDGQAPYSFDHTEYSNDGDPVPIFTAGYGVNWRHAAGLSTVGIDLVLDSQRAKQVKYNKKIVNYVLNGDPSISVSGYKAQGIKNHRNTVKLNLGSGGGGANIDLTTATTEELLAFFGQAGPFAKAARDNKVAAYDILWVSPEIWANLARPYLINIGPNNALTPAGTVLNAILPFTPIREIRMTFALVGNEFLGYQRRQDVISPLVGMTTGVVPLPRLMPQANYNFQIMGAMGLQIKRDASGKAGVIYGANLL